MGSERRLSELQAWARQVTDAVAGRELPLYPDETPQKISELREALREIHDYHCGCDQPGRYPCSAKPRDVFGVLA